MSTKKTATRPKPTKHTKHTQPAAVWFDVARPASAAPPTTDRFRRLRPGEHRPIGDTLGRTGWGGCEIWGNKVSQATRRADQLVLNYTPLAHLRSTEMALSEALDQASEEVQTNQNVRAHILKLNAEAHKFVRLELTEADRRVARVDVYSPFVALDNPLLDYVFRRRIDFFDANELVDAVEQRTVSGTVALERAANSVRADPRALACCYANGFTLRGAKEDLRDFEEVVVAAVANDANSLRYASPRLRASREIVLSAVASNGASLKYADDALKDDDDVFKAAVNTSWGAVEHASPRIRSSVAFMRACCASDGRSLRFASEEVCGDRGVVLEAVRSRGRALEYASDALKDDVDVVTQAVRCDADALFEAGPTARTDPGVALEAIANGIRVDRVFEIAPLLVHDAAVVRAAVAEDGATLYFADATIQANEDVVRVAVSSHGRALEYASEELRADREVVALAVHADPSAIEFAGRALREDPELRVAAGLPAGCGWDYTDGAEDAEGAEGAQHSDNGAWLSDSGDEGSPKRARHV